MRYAIYNIRTHFLIPDCRQLITGYSLTVGSNLYKFPCSQIYSNVIRTVVVYSLALCACPSRISFRAKTFEAVSNIHTRPSMFTGIDVAWLWLSYSYLISNATNSVIWPQLFKRWIAPGGEGEEVLNKFLHGEAPPRGPTFIYHFSRERHPFRIPSIDKWYLSNTYLVQNFASLSELL